MSDPASESRPRRKLPAARTLELLRKLGWRAVVVERRLPIPRIRIPVLKDAFGFGDLLAMDGLHGAVLVQACRSADMAARQHKITDQCTDDARAWLERGNRIYVVGWAQRGSRGKRKLWTPRFVEVVLGEYGFETYERAELAPTEART